MVPKSTAAIVVSLGLLASPSNAQEVVKACAGAGVRWVKMSAEKKVHNGAPPAEIDILPVKIPATASGAAERAVTIIARGPKLGPMDSEEVKTDLACTENGIALTATITRLANYPDAALGTTFKGGYPWRPQIAISVVLRQPEVVLQTTWRMRLTTGSEVNRARTPPYPEQEYPITVTKTVHAPSSEKQ